MSDLHSLTQPPAPRMLSVILVIALFIAHGMSEINHAAFNRWLTTGIGICALISYGHTFLKWRKKRAADKKATQYNLKNKSGGHR